MVRVLVVDDHDYWCDLISEILNTQGFSTVTASSRKEALTLLRNSVESEEYFQLVTLDHNLVDAENDSVGIVDSQAILEYLKTSYPVELAVVIISGRANTRDVRDYFISATSTIDGKAISKVSQIDYVDKNGFRIQEFTRVISNLLERIQTTNTVGIRVRNQVFISYSHLDEKWLTRIKRMLKPVLRNENNLIIWDDSRIEKGAMWRDEIDLALQTAKVAVLLVSDNFLNSEFINSVELPVLLEASEKEGLTVLWIAVSHSMYKETAIEKYQCVNIPSKPLDSFTRKADIDREILEICNHIKTVAKSGPTATN